MTSSWPPGFPVHGPDIGDDPLAARDMAGAHVAEAAAGLAHGFRTVIPRAIVLQVERLVTAWGGLGPDDRRRVASRAAQAGQQAGRELAEAWERESSQPLAAQRHGPLEFLRDAAGYGTRVLAEAGVPPVRRDRFVAERFPADVYGLIVERFSDLGVAGAEELQALHLAWGVGRAMWVKAEQAARA